MTVTHARRVRRRKWLELPLLATVLLVAVAAVMARDPAAGTIGWAESVFALYVVTYLVLAPLLLRAMGVWDRWEVGLANDRDISLAIVYYDAFLPFFQEYVVTVGGAEAARQKGGWGASDRLQFQIGDGPPLEVEAVFTGIDVWPFARRKLALSVDDEEVVTV